MITATVRRGSSLLLLLLLIGPACASCSRFGDTDSAADAGTALCKMLDEMGSDPLAWVDADGRLVAPQRASGALALALAVGDAVGDPEAHLTEVHELLNARLGGEALALTEDEAGALRRLSKWREANC